MDDDEPSVRRPAIREGEESNRIVNEFLIAVFVPAIGAFVSLWAAFRLYFDRFLLSLGLGRVTPDPLPFVAIESGYGRFLLLVVSSAFVVVVYLGLYLRFLRGRLKERNLV